MKAINKNTCQICALAAFCMVSLVLLVLVFVFA